MFCFIWCDLILIKGLRYQKCQTKTSKYKYVRQNHDFLFDSVNNKYIIYSQVLIHLICLTHHNHNYLKFLFKCTFLIKLRAFSLFFAHSLYYRSQLINYKRGWYGSPTQLDSSKRRRIWVVLLWIKIFIENCIIINMIVDFHR